MEYNELKISDTKEKAKKKIIIAVIVFALIITAGAVASILAVAEKERHENESAVLSAQIPGLTGDCSFFVSAVDDNKTTVDFALIIRAQLYNKTFVITPLDINKKYDSNNSLSLLDSYKNGGIKEMSAAAKKISGTSVDKYIRVTRSGLAMIFGELGHVEFDIDSPITLTVSEGSVNIQAGRQELDYEEITDYLIKGAKGSDSLNFLAKNTAVIMEQYLANVDYANTDRLFNSIINNVDTDISASDYFDAKDCIKAFESTSFVFKTEY